MKNGWRKIKLEECVDLLTGYPFKSDRFTSNPEDIPLIKGENIHQGYIDWNNPKRWPREILNDLEKYWLSEGDVILAMDRPWIEAGLKFAWVRKNDPRSLLVQRVSRLRGKGCLRTNYLRYIIASAFFTDYIKPIVTGVSVPHISPSQIKNFEFVLPSLETQDQITSLLSEYDDLIENNTRRLEILEGMAKLIYREWFVEFKGPGVKLRKASLEEKKVTGKNLFPEGWEVTRLGKVVHNHDSKRKPISSMKREEMKGEYPYYGAAKVVDHVNDYIFDGKYLLVAEDGSVVTSDRKPVLQLVDCRFWPNNHTHVIQGKDPVSTDFLFLRLSHLDVTGYITGAAQPKITQENLNRIPVVIGTDKIMDEFSQAIGANISLGHKLEKQNATLRQTRDLLMPKLLSGEIEV